MSIITRIVEEVKRTRGGDTHWRTDWPIRDHVTGPWGLWTYILGERWSILYSFLSNIDPWLVWLSFGSRTSLNEITIFETICKIFRGTRSPQNTVWIMHIDTINNDKLNTVLWSTQIVDSYLSTVRIHIHLGIYHGTAVPRCYNFQAPYQPDMTPSVSSFVGKICRTLKSL